MEYFRIRDSQGRIVQTLYPTRAKAMKEMKLYKTMNIYKNDVLKIESSNLKRAVNKLTRIRKIRL